MKGIELAESYYRFCGEELINRFPDLADKITVGLVGEGSECFGYDDEVSTDHDFEPCFCMWIDKSEEDKTFPLERGYAKLPKEYLGYLRQKMSPCGGNRHGVLITEDFYEKFLAKADLSRPEEWMNIPSYALATASNGRIFKEGNGAFMRIRSVLLAGYPEDVRKKKISAYLATMAQSGMYNYARCLGHGEKEAAHLSICEYVRSAVQTAYLLNGAYCPFYKWAFRGLRQMNILSEIAPLLSSLLIDREEDSNQKLEKAEEVNCAVIDELHRQKLTQATCYNLDTHAFSVADGIRDSYLRNLHIMETGK